MASRSSRKWRFCQHCQEYVSGRTYREHYDLYFKKSSAQWRTIDSSDEEGSRQHEAHFDVLDDESFQSTSRLATVMMKMRLKRLLKVTSVPISNPLTKARKEKNE